MEPCIADKVVAVEKSYVFAGGNLCTEISGQPQVADIRVLDLNAIVEGPDCLNCVPRHSVGDDKYLGINAASRRIVCSVKHTFDCSACHRSFGVHVYDACNCRHWKRSRSIKSETEFVNAVIGWRDSIKCRMAAIRLWPLPRSNSKATSRKRSENAAMSLGSSTGQPVCNVTSSPIPPSIGAMIGSPRLAA